MTPNQSIFIHAVPAYGQVGNELKGIISCNEPFLLVGALCMSGVQPAVALGEDGTPAILPGCVAGGFLGLDYHGPLLRSGHQLRFALPLQLPDSIKCLYVLTYAEMPPVVQLGPLVFPATISFFQAPNQGYQPFLVHYDSPIVSAYAGVQYSGPRSEDIDYVVSLFNAAFRVGAAWPVVPFPANWSIVSI
jgi:hypothetical protein